MEQEKEGQGDLKFLCTGCGLCCKHVGAALLYPEMLPETRQAEMKKFPHKAKKDGSCEMLGIDGKCMDYENRPDICKTESMFEKYHSHETTKKEYFVESNKICNVMITAANLDKKFLIDIKQYD